QSKTHLPTCSRRSARRAPKHLPAQDEAGRDPRPQIEEGEILAVARRPPDFPNRSCRAVFLDHHRERETLSEFLAQMHVPPPRQSEEHTSELQSRFDLVCR